MSRGVARGEGRAFRVRSRLRAVAGDRLRLSVVKTNRHLYAQIIDDSSGSTLVFASTNSAAFRLANSGAKTWCNARCAESLGDVFADVAGKAGVELSKLEVYFDRGSSPYVGVIKALAERLRANGLCF